MPNQTWQSDFTHYPLTDTQAFPKDVEIITWLGDCTRYAPHVSAHRVTTTPIVKTTSAKPQVSTASPHPRSPTKAWSTPSGSPASVAVVAATGSSNNSVTGTWSRRTPSPTTPTTCGKAERFQQTMKKWLRAQPDQPATIAELQALLDRFPHEYNTAPPHRSLPHRATPAALYDTMPKAVPGPSRDADTTTGSRMTASTSPPPSPCAYTASSATSASDELTREPTSSCSSQDLDVRIVNAITGELLRELTIDTNKDYQPRK